MKQLFFSLLAVAFMAGVTSCDSNQRAKAYSSSAGWNGAPSYAEEAYANAGGTPSLNSGRDLRMEDKSEPAPASRMINYTAYVSIDAKDPDSTAARVAALSKKYDGYLTSLGATYITIAVRSSNLQAALNDIYTFGKVTGKSITGQDVTDQYTDLKVRLDNANRTRARYLELLNKAANVAEMVSIEKELERLNLEIDRLTGSINKLEHDNDYSTITVTVGKRKKPGIVGYVFVGLYKGVKWLFVRG